jgi:hypothetical protein
MSYGGPQYLRDAAIAHAREHGEVTIADLRPHARGSTLSTQRSLASTTLRALVREGVMWVVRREPAGRRTTPVCALVMRSQNP